MAMVDRAYVGQHSFYTENFSGSVTMRDDVIFEKDRWDITVRVNGSGHLIHTFATRASGATLDEAFNRLLSELNSLCRFYGKSYVFRATTDRCDISKTEGWS